MSNNNCNKKKLSSRCTPKVREYLAEIANERETELERFMMLSSASPASSGVSVGAQSQHNSNNNHKQLAMRSSRRCRASRDEDQQEEQVINIPIEMVSRPAEEEKQEEQQLPQPSCLEEEEAEQLRTPIKTHADTHTQTPTQPLTHTRKTQTPESALKSHKRLEWDPAADVGYHRRSSGERAVSTSNISTLERSVLEAAMQPLQATQRSNHSESDLKRLQLEKQPEIKAPLASSTFMAPRSTPVTSTNQSSRRGSCLTSSAASSFDYQHNSRPSTAGTGRSHTSSSSRQQHWLSDAAEQQRQEREYAAQLEQQLGQRRRQLSSSQHRDQNKENQQPGSKSNCSNSSSASSALSCAAAKNDVDLGIDLLCALVNKRSLSSGQKKQLARDIIKRLVGLDLACGSSSRPSTAQSRSRSQQGAACKEQAQQTDQTEAQTKGNCQQQDVATNTSRSLQQEQQLLTLAVPVPAPRTRLATPTDQQLEPCSYASTSSGASNELLTQKANVEARQEPDEQAAMQEWLNPMTQSEIEYEQRQRQQQEQQQQKQDHNLSQERRTQIDWIEGEIRRLYALQELLHRGARGEQEEQPNTQREAREQQQAVESTQDKVKSTLPLGRRPAPPAPPVTPVSMPGAATAAATATIVGAGEGKAINAAATTAPRAVTIVPPRTAARKPADIGAAEKVIGIEAVAAASPPTPPPLPLPAATGAARQLQLQLQQRGKMATPQLSHSGSSESVCSFVQQRQRQFLAHYQNQQQQRREQQQQQLFLRQQQQQQLLYHQQQQQQHPHVACHHLYIVLLYLTHASLLLQLHPSHCHHEHRERLPHAPHYVQMQYAHAAGHAYSCLDDGAIYYQVVNSQEAQATATAKASAAVDVAAAVVAATVERSSNTSSSLLCLSSEMSIPMGMATACEATTSVTTTTTTTTHQYDDVACQQLQLQLQLQQRQRRHHRSKQRQHMELQQQQMLQVRPRGIAYVLQFDSHDDAGQMLAETLTVQDYLQRARPQFCAKSKQRKAILNEMQLLRNARRRELDELIEGHSLETIDRRLQQLPPPVTAKVRIFSTREMKALTSKRCENLPEVIAAQNREREERRRRSNRIMRDVFNRRLQRRVRSGKLSLNHSRTVI
ncbi:hypothetical protein KR044_006722 [Drosophila immigrans]|nr:hypothetical protein KR044_006722 [Drosophila immigrans]